MGARERLIAKFHYTDTDTDTDIFVAKLRWVRAGPFRRKKVRVRVVEFSFKRNIAEERNGVIAVRTTPHRYGNSRATWDQYPASYGRDPYT